MYFTQTHLLSKSRRYICSRQSNMHVIVFYIFSYKAYFVHLVDLLLFYNLFPSISYNFFIFLFSFLSNFMLWQNFYLPIALCCFIYLRLQTLIVQLPNILQLISICHELSALFLFFGTVLISSTLLCLIVTLCSYRNFFKKIKFRRIHYNILILLLAFENITKQKF